jgi:hypothetical protein
MKKKTSQQYNEMTQVAAWKIVKALSVFDGEPDRLRDQCEQIVMQRVQLMRNGEGLILEGDDLIKVILDEEVKEDAGSSEEPPSP